MTLIFDLYAILIGEGRQFYHKKSDVSMMNRLKVDRIFIEN